MENKMLADAFANSNGEEQGRLLNEIARVLFCTCGGRYGLDRKGGYEQQCYHIARELNADGMTFIEDLAEFIKLRKEPMK